MAKPATTLLIRLRAPDLPFTWLSLDARGQVLAGPRSGERPDPSELDGAERIVVLVPAADVLLARTELAARQREQIEQALPYALEDQLVESVEAMHVAWSQDPEGGQSVAAVRRATLESWLSLLAARDIQPDALVVDAAALPLEPGTISVLVEGDHALIRTGRNEAGALDSESLGAWLGVALQQRGAGTRVLLHDQDRSAAELPRSLALERIEPPPPALAWLAPGALAPDAVNLLSGRYAPEHRGQSVRRLWRYAALLAGGVVALWFALALTEYGRLSRALARTNAEIASMYRQSFPDANTVPSSSAAIRSEFERVGQRGGGGIALLKQLGPVLTASTQYTVRSLDYRGGALDLVLIADSVATLDAVRERVLAMGMKASLSAVSAGELGTEAKLHVEVAP